MNPSHPSRPQGPRVRINAPQPAGRSTTRTRPLDPAFDPTEGAAPPPSVEHAAEPPPRRAAPARPTARQAYLPARGGAGFFTKAFIWLLLLSLGAIVGGAYLLKGEDGKRLSETFIHLAKVKLKMEPPEPPAPPPPKLEDDAKFKEIVDARKAAQTLIEKASGPDSEITVDAAAEIENRVDLLAKNIQELATLSAKFPGTGPEIAEHAKLQKDLAGTLANIKATLEKVAAAKAIDAAKKAKLAAEYDLMRINPWNGRSPKTWVRSKTTAGKSVIYEDQVLDSIGEWGALVKVSAFAGDQPFPLPARAWAGGKAKVAREEPLKIGDTETACTLVEDGGATLWIPKSGPLADRWAVKHSGGDQVTALGEEEVDVKGEKKKCVRFERGGATFWGHPDVPGFIVRAQSDGAVTEVVDWGSGDRPEWPQPPKPAEAAADARDAFKRAHPWSAAKPGMWTRRKADYVSPLATSETGMDTTVLEAGEREVTLRFETLGLDGQVKVVEQKTPFALPGSKISGEETLTIGNAPYPCVILETPVEMGTVKTWIAKEGRAGQLAAVLKTESMTSSRQATAIDEAPLRVGRHEVKCLHVTSEGRRDDNAMKEEVWLSEDVPGLEVRRETVQQTIVGAARSTTTLLDFGDIPARKTAIGFQKEDPARLEEQRVLKVLDDAEQLLIGASVGYRDLLSAARDLPTDPARLRELLRLSEEVTSQLSKAKEEYTSVRERAPQAAGVEEKIAKIDRAVASVAKMRESLQAKLK